MFSRPLGVYIVVLEPLPFKSTISFRVYEEELQLEELIRVILRMFEYRDTENGISRIATQMRRGWLGFLGDIKLKVSLGV